MAKTSDDNSQDQIIEGLGDCNLVPVEHMDLLSHRTRCRKIEIFHFDDEVSFTPNDTDVEEEEDQGLSFAQFTEDHTDDVDRTVQLAGDVDCLIRRIQQMQLIIKQRKQDQQQLDTTEVSTEQQEEEEVIKQPPIPQLGKFLFQECMEQTLEETKLDILKRELKAEMKPDSKFNSLSCDEQLEIRDLRHAHHRLQCEIDEMVCNACTMRELLLKIRNQVGQDKKRLLKLAAIATKHHEWSNLIYKELPVCKQRYQYLLEKKLSKSEAHRLIHAHMVKVIHYNKKFLTRRELRYELREFHLEIDELEKYVNDLRQDMVRRFSSIENET
ncbi:uncharacterized protein LOC6565702 [Drosophila grimshawi]|uniref:GH24276 n=1 Tax=Drosophila grimshawi TaxID=7222 RepID=B4JMS4_DROGR|nr:uncharacterized protein LOC6565702 [Drosophila grimshawi]EDV92017.1 GH24276 [Drosophila grimshawi]